MRTAHRITSIGATLALAIALASGCGDEPSTRTCEAFRISKELTDDERASVARAFGRFNDFVGSEAVRLDSSGECTIEPFVGPEAPGLLGRMEASQLELATDRASGRVLEAVVLHELGHARGLRHLGIGERGIMHEAGGVEFTDADRRECVRAGVCAR